MFDDSVSINPVISVENDPLFRNQNQQELSLSSNDSSAIFQAAVQIANNTQVVSSSVLPDLRITAQTVPVSFYAGDRINFTYTEKNVGSGNAKSSTTKFWLSSDRTLSNNDILLGSDTVPPINVGQSRVESASFTIRATQPAGRYYVLFQADANQQISENNENNNILASAQITLKSKLPDLTLPTLNAPARANAGSTITINYTEKNQGLGNANNHQTKFYLSQDKIIDSNDVLLGNNSEASLAANTTRSRSKTVTLGSNLLSGNYYLIAAADGLSRINEANENNNIATKLITINEQSKPDLLFDSFSSQSVATAGETININYNLKNAGNATALASQTKFYLSTDAVWDSSDVFLDSNAEASLNAGASRNGSQSVTIGTNVASGNYYLIGVADANGQVAELNETNNYSTAQAINITGVPDLTISSLSSPVTTVQPGATLTLNYTEQNLGGGNVGYHYMDFYLSTDNVFDSDDTYLTYASISSLAAQSSYSDSVNANLSSSLSAGTYYVFAIADPYNYVAESNEDNNVSDPLEITVSGSALLPDLVISSVSNTSIDTDIDFAYFYVDYTETNQGNAFADGHNIQLYVSTDDTFDEFDQYLTLSDYYLDGLLPGETNIGTAYGIFDYYYISNGDYYLFLITDAYDEVAESDELNNASSPIPIII